MTTDPTAGLAKPRVALSLVVFHDRDQAPGWNDSEIRDLIVETLRDRIPHLNPTVSLTRFGDVPDGHDEDAHAVVDVLAADLYDADEQRHLPDRIVRQQLARFLASRGWRKGDR